MKRAHHGMRFENLCVVFAGSFPSVLFFSCAGVFSDGPNAVVAVLFLLVSSRAVRMRCLRWLCCFFIGNVD